MKRKNTSTVILFVLLFIGLSLLLYPTVSDYWNSLRQSRAIASYVESVSNLDADRYAALLEEAQQYNASLVGKEARFAPTDEDRAAFMSLLGSTGGAVCYMEIGAIKLSLPIYLGSDETVLQVGVGIMEGSSLPVGGPSTHTALTGHRGLPSATLFTNLDRLSEGDIFSIHILNETCTYEVDRILIVEPQDVSPLAIVEGEDLCTLVTCTPYGVNSHRLLVRGHRIDTPEDGAAEQISADALQVAPLLIAPMVAVPLVIILLAFLWSGTAKQKKSRPQHTRAKKGGNSDDNDQKKDR